VFDYFSNTNIAFFIRFTQFLKVAKVLSDRFKVSAFHQVNFMWLKLLMQIFVSTSFGCKLP